MDDFGNFLNGISNACASMNNSIDRHWQQDMHDADIMAMQNQQQRIASEQRAQRERMMRIAMMG